MKVVRAHKGYHRSTTASTRNRVTRMTWSWRGPDVAHASGSCRRGLPPFQRHPTGDSRGLGGFWWPTARQTWMNADVTWSGEVPVESAGGLRRAAGRRCDRSSPKSRRTWSLASSPLASLLFTEWINQAICLYFQPVNICSYQAVLLVSLEPPTQYMIVVSSHQEIQSHRGRLSRNTTLQKSP